MQIIFERSGGFMGSKLKTAVDTTQLPAEEAEELERMLTANQFLQLPSKREPAGGFDQFNYELTVITNEWQHTVMFTDAHVTEEMQPVIRRLTKMARQAAED
jgi:hypothetical protein